MKEGWEILRGGMLRGISKIERHRGTQGHDTSAMQHERHTWRDRGIEYALRTEECEMENGRGAEDTYAARHERNTTSADRGTQHERYTPS
eukprot:5552576-Pleurochrysis_carterae.AAC.1